MVKVEDLSCLEELLERSCYFEEYTDATGPLLYTVYTVFARGPNKQENEVQLFLYTHDVI